MKSKVLILGGLVFAFCLAFYVIPSYAQIVFQGPTTVIEAHQHIRNMDLNGDKVPDYRETIMTNVHQQYITEQGQQMEQRFNEIVQVENYVDPQTGDIAPWGSNLNPVTEVRTDSANPQQIPSSYQLQYSPLNLRYENGNPMRTEAIMGTFDGVDESWMYLRSDLPDERRLNESEADIHREENIPPDQVRQWLDQHGATLR
jgi:hypothetical protein